MICPRKCLALSPGEGFYGLAAAACETGVRLTAKIQDL